MSNSMKKEHGHILGMVLQNRQGQYTSSVQSKSTAGMGRLLELSRYKQSTAAQVPQVPHHWPRVF